jgi:RimJ/RimL family protein N-acetyltransferase
MPSVDYLLDDIVSLCPLEDADVPTMQRWISDQAVLHYLGASGGVSLAQEQSWLDNIRKSPTECVLGIRLRRDNRLIGSIGLHGINARSQHAELGISIGERDCWGKGFGTAAARLILDHGFNQLNLHRIFLRVFSHNARGIASYRKLGFVEEGRLRQHEWSTDGWVDVVFMGQLRDEFNEQHADWRAAQRERYGIPAL